MTIYGEDLHYKLTSCLSDIINNLQIPGVISVVLSIEGGYAINMDNIKPATVAILSNIDLVKQWPHLFKHISLKINENEKFGIKIGSSSNL
jgi:hypothetical protein